MDSSHSPTVFPFRPPIAPCHWKPPRLAVRPILTSTIALALLSVALVSSTSDAVPPDAHLWNTNINLSDQIHQNTEQPTNPSPRSAESEDELLAALQSDISPESKRALFRDLRRLATDKSTSALAQLLSHTNFAHEARSVLEVIPGQRSTAALIRALRETKGNQLIGVVASLGNRRSPEAVQPLIALLSDRDPNVVRSAVSALGKIATDQALSL
ncbi:MAG: HEAT repeat domain-containing protein, partial [Verrucomicrobiae bacterium]|nr:HEAT repeat domain-containing protein [Verrucomicrobiae bacterium]